MAEAKKLKSVAIIGAGPSALISAHHLLTANSGHNFAITIFEKKTQIGGLWPVYKHDNDRMIDPLMRANQSRHTMQFGATGQRLYAKDEQEDEDVGIFPKAWQVGRYLSRLAEEVNVKGAKFETQTEVIGVEKVEGGQDRWEDEGRIRIYDEGMRWRVKTRKTSSQPAEDGIQEQERIFDFVVIASGFFGTPKIPEKLRPYLCTITPSPPSAAQNAEEQTKQEMDSPLGIPVIHSSTFPSLTRLLSTSTTPPSPRPPTSSAGGKQKILIIGGSMSGTEIASSIAFELSSLQHSPGTSAHLNPQDYEVVHVASRPFYTLPRYLPLSATSPAPEFLPCDLIFNNLVPRRGTRGTNNAGEISPATAEKVHKFYQTLSGQDRPHAWIEGEDIVCDAPWLAICDDYTPHVLSGNIKTVRGSLVGLQHTGAKDSSISAVVETPKGDELIDDVAAVILATGFSSTNSLSFLSESMKEDLEYIPDSYTPLGISWHSTISRKFPTLGFVGIYNGPFWGVMEQQALLLTSLWSRFLLPPSDRKEAEEDVHLAGRLPYLCNHAAGTRNVEYPGGVEWGEKNKEAWRRLTQFPMGDYVFVMTDLLGLRGRRLDDEGFDDRDDGEIPGVGCYPLVPDAAEVREYLGEEDLGYRQDVERLKTSPARNAVQRTVDEGIAGRFYPRNLFRALLGRWKLERTITSKHPSYPSGTLSGSAVFYPRTPTSRQYSGEYLYEEEGEFRTDNGLSMRASRRYVWRLEPGKEGGGEGVDKLSQWFVKVSGPEKNLGVDYLFHELDIIRPDGVSLSSSTHAPNGGACPLTKSTTPSNDGEVKGGWTSSSHRAVDKAMGELTISDNAETEEKAEGKKEEGLWTARGHHLCIDDTYDPEYVFRWKGAELEGWTMGYTVKGPGKDYFIESKFTREK